MQNGRVVDLTQYDGVWAAFDEVSESARREALFHGRIVGAATAWRLPGRTRERHSALRCTAASCAGRLLVGLRRSPARVRWECPACGDAGLIENWMSSPWWWPRMPMSRRALEGVIGGFADDPVKAILLDEQYDLLLEFATPGSEAAPAILAAFQTPRGILFVSQHDDAEWVDEALYEDFDRQPPHSARGAAPWGLMEVFADAFELSARMAGRASPPRDRRPW